MVPNEVLEGTIKRTLQMARLAAENGEIVNSRYFGLQFKDILLEIRAVALDIPPVDLEITPPLKIAKVRRFYQKKLRSKINKIEKKQITIDLDEMCQLFCPFCWIYLTSQSTLGVKIGMEQDNEVSFDVSDLMSNNSTTAIEARFKHSNYNSPLSVSYYCKVCQRCLPDYQFKAESSVD